MQKYQMDANWLLPLMTFAPKLKLQENLSQCLPMFVKIALLMTTTLSILPTGTICLFLQKNQMLPWSQWKEEEYLNRRKVGSLGGQTLCSIHHADQGQQ